MLNYEKPNLPVSKISSYTCNTTLARSKPLHYFIKNLSDLNTLNTSGIKTFFEYSGKKITANYLKSSVINKKTHLIHPCFKGWTTKEIDTFFEIAQLLTGKSEFKNYTEFLNLAKKFSEAWNNTFNSSQSINIAALQKLLKAQKIKSITKAQNTKSKTIGDPSVNFLALHYKMIDLRNAQSFKKSFIREYLKYGAALCKSNLLISDNNNSAGVHGTHLKFKLMSDIIMIYKTVLTKHASSENLENFQIIYSYLKNFSWRQNRPYNYYFKEITSSNFSFTPSKGISTKKYTSYSTDHVTKTEFKIPDKVLKIISNTFLDADDAYTNKSALELSQIFKDFSKVSNTTFYFHKSKYDNRNINFAFSLKTSIYQRKYFVVKVIASGSSFKFQIEEKPYLSLPNKKYSPFSHMPSGKPFTPIYKKYLEQFITQVKNHKK